IFLFFKRSFPVLSLAERPFIRGADQELVPPPSHSKASGALFPSSLSRSQARCMSSPGGSDGGDGARRTAPPALPPRIAVPPNLLGNSRSRPSSLRSERSNISSAGSPRPQPNREPSDLSGDFDACNEDEADEEQSSRSPPPDGGAGGGLGGSGGVAGIPFDDEDDARMPTISFYDPLGLWEHIDRALNAYLPLRSVTVRSPITRSPFNVAELPVRSVVHRSLASMEARQRRWAAPEDWHRGPFARVYLAAADSQEHYRTAVRPRLREWVEAADERRGGAWLILYVYVAPQRQLPAAAAAAADRHSKIFGLICADFYARVPGDRCAFVTLYVDTLQAQATEAGSSGGSAAMAAAAAAAAGGAAGTGASSPPSNSASPGGALGISRHSSASAANLVGGGSSGAGSFGGLSSAPPPPLTPAVSAISAGGEPVGPRHHPKQWSDLLAKLGQAVAETFETKTTLYEEELRRLEATRGGGAGGGVVLGAAGAWDFTRFFMVKEGFALMCQALQLPSEALPKYQELAALIMTLADPAAATAAAAGGGGGAANGGGSGVSLIGASDG
ncbi:unnamed protein product, partial [Phaeothamnion confervicola]